MTTRLLLLRHAESEWNALGRWQGWGDPPLSREGRDQAARGATALSDFTGPVVSSDLRRASETAQILATLLGLGDVTIEPGVREVDVGDWSGLTHDEIEHRFPGALAAWRAGTLPRAHGGELREAFLERIVAATQRIADGFAGNSVLVLTHGGVIHALERHLGVHVERVPNLGGQWFEAASPLRAVGDPVRLLPDDEG